jgi:hypothetical protein
VSGEAVEYGMRSPEAIVTMLLLSDGDKTRKNRSFVLNPDVRFAVFSLVESDAKGPVGVLSLLSHFYKTIDGNRTVEMQGPIEKRRRPMPPEMRDVLDAIPSEEAVNVVMVGLAQGKRAKIDYTPNSVVITMTDRHGKRQVSKMKWK